MPSGVEPGQIYRHEQYYKDSEGGLRPKYLLILAKSLGDDLVVRLLTSRQHGRPRTPPCYHDDPYPGFYLGYLGGELTTESWLDLRGMEDLDGLEFADHLDRGVLRIVCQLPRDQFCEALSCAAGADDTTRLQERLMRDQRAVMGCL